MALLTTSKLLAVFDHFAAQSRTGLLRLLEEVEANETARAKYESSMSSSGYREVQKAMIADIEAAAVGKTGKSGRFSRAVDALTPGKLTLQQNAQYYLIKGFTASESRTGKGTPANFHIRFENPGEGEIEDFHLTTEEGWPRVNFGGGLWAKGHFFFKIDKGLIEPKIKNQIVGQGIDQLSDMRMGTMVNDVMIYVYYLMYCCTTV